MDMPSVQLIFAYVSAVITFATLALQGLAFITRITPSTADDELLGRAQRWVKQAQRLLGLIALDTGTTHKKPSGPNKPGGSGKATVTSMVLFPMILSMCLMVAGCVSLATPKTPAQSLAYTEGTYTAVVNQAVALRDANQLTADQESRLDDLIQRGDVALTAAHAALASGETGTVQSRLAAADAVLVALRDIVQKEITHQEMTNGQ